MLADLSAIALMFCVMFTLVGTAVLLDTGSRRNQPNAAGDVLAVATSTLAGLTLSLGFGFGSPSLHADPATRILLSTWAISCLVVFVTMVVVRIKDLRDPETSTR